MNESVIVSSDSNSIKPSSPQPSTFDILTAERKKQIVYEVARGLPPETVARSVGCHPDIIKDFVREALKSNLDHQRESIVKQVLNQEASVSEAAKKYAVPEKVVRQWVAEQRRDIFGFGHKTGESLAASSNNATASNLILPTTSESNREKKSKLRKKLQKLKHCPICGLDKNPLGKRLNMASHLKVEHSNHKDISKYLPNCEEQLQNFNYSNPKWEENNIIAKSNFVSSHTFKCLFCDLFFPSKNKRTKHHRCNHNEAWKLLREEKKPLSEYRKALSINLQS